MPALLAWTNEIIGPVNEMSSVRYYALVVDEAGDDADLTILETLTVTLYDKKTGTVINGRTSQDILNANGVTIYAARQTVAIGESLFPYNMTWLLTANDNGIVGTDPVEDHAAMFVGTWSGGTLQVRHEFAWKVINLQGTSAIVVPGDPAPLLVSPVGINVATPEFTIHARSTTDPGAYVMDAVGIVGANFIGRRSRGTVATPTAVQAGDTLINFAARGYDGAAWSPDRAGFGAFAAENWEPGKHGTYLRFTIRQIGTTTLIETMRQTTNGTRLGKCLTFADNATALAGGLVAGDVYRTATGELRIVI